MVAGDKNEPNLDIVRCCSDTNCVVLPVTTTSVSCQQLASLQDRHSTSSTNMQSIKHYTMRFDQYFQTSCKRHYPGELFSNAASSNHLRPKSNWHFVFYLSVTYFQFQCPRFVSFYSNSTQLKFIKTGSWKAEHTHNNLYRYSKIHRMWI